MMSINITGRKVGKQSKPLHTCSMVHASEHLGVFHQDPPDRTQNFEKHFIVEIDNDT